MNILVAIPCFDKPEVSFIESLIGLFGTSSEHSFSVQFATSSLIYDARNGLSERAIKAGCDAVLWLDADMSFKPDVFEMLIDDLMSGKDIVSGLYFNRRPPFKPAIFEQCDIKSIGENELYPLTRYVQHIPDETFEIEACGFGCVLMRTEVLQNVAQNFGLGFSPLVGFGEDLSFCYRAKKIGYKIWCNPNAILGHTAHIVIGGKDYKNSWNAHPILE